MRYPETMYPSFSGITIQPHAVRVPGQPVHDGPADAAGLVDLQTEVIVGACNWVVMLVDDEMRTL